MPKWFWGFFWFLVLIVFIIPDPAGAGATVGKAFSAFVTFIATTVDVATSSV
jgi:hypothetical protein